MSPEQLKKRLHQCLRIDQHRFRRRLSKLRHQNDKEKNHAALKQLEQEIEKSINVVTERDQKRPTPDYDEMLPINQRRDEIAALIEKNQVVIVCGETGSGKSTQLPKICLEMGRGVKGLIGHTQPRRIAARTVAARVAEELHSQPGKTVGYKIRFTDHVSADTYIKLMTDGILLAETQGDRFLDAYDTLIIDEAHERSLNIDFLLGFLKNLLPRRPDLKIIITSATIDPERLSKHFNNAPVIEVSGRTYPVVVHYRPLVDPNDEEQERDLVLGILDVVDEISQTDLGDILIFLPGEHEIRETTEALKRRHLKNTEILPLYAKLGVADQNKVFQPHNKRHIVLATNVAETSLTVPGIRFVIDPGLARMSRYSPRSKVQRLPIEPISQASANQRKGRCGRVSDGICYRLYSEEDFIGRSLFTDPEIKRTNLASVILQLSSLRFGDVDRFPFIDPPDGKYISDGFKLLEELGAVTAQRQLTSLGKKLARLPVDPRIGRMILAGHEFHCLKEMLIIASALSVQDVRDKPMDKMQQSDEAHAKFAHEDSDFYWFLNVWRFYKDQESQLSQNKLRKLCKTNFLNYLRMREWFDIHRQLTSLCKEMEFKQNSEEAKYQSIHSALLSGLLGNIAFQSDRHEYTGARNIKMNIFPGSAQFQKKPKWFIAAELVETSKLYARTVAKIEPEWIEKIAGDLVKRSYSDPFWSKKAGHVVALEKTSLYGLVLSTDRRVNFGRIDPIESRRLFIQSGLIPFDLSHSFPFLKHNQKLVKEVEALEHRARRLDILVDETAQYNFYDQALPVDINNAHGLKKWYQTATQEDPSLLFFDKDFLIREESKQASESAMPSSLQVGGLGLPLNYHFSPGAKDDGVTLSVPVAMLNQLDEKQFDWLVPGLIKEKVTELIRSLPKQLRKNFVPAPNFAEACLQAITYGEGDLLLKLRDHLHKMTGITVEPAQWDQDRLPDHLKLNFKVIDAHGKVVSEGRNLFVLQGKLEEHAEQIFTEDTSWDIECDHLTSWNFGDLPSQVETTRHNMPLRGFPALLDKADHVAILVVDTKEKAQLIHREGLRRLFMLVCSDKVKYLSKNLKGFDKTSLKLRTICHADELKADLINAIVDQSFMAASYDIRNESQFDAACAKGQRELMLVANKLCEKLSEIADAYFSVNKRLESKTPLSWLQAVQSIRMQCSKLIKKNFVTETPPEWFIHFPRYFKAIDRRLDKLDHNPAKDKSLDRSCSIYWERLSSTNDRSQKWIEIRWMIEELRVSLFAQELGTAMSVSEKRIEKLWDAYKADQR